jgi:hypothetical protein
MLCAAFHLLSETATPADLCNGQEKLPQSGLHNYPASTIVANDIRTA